MGGKEPAANDLVSKLAELDRLVQLKAGIAFVGSVPVPDGGSYWSKGNLNAPVMPDSPTTPATLLKTHEGLEETRFVTEIGRGHKRIIEINARLARLAAKEEDVADNAAKKIGGALLP